MSRRALARRLAAVEGFDDPRPALEQYLTPPDLAAHLVHRADLHGDLDGRTVVDLGAGTGMLALAAACRDPARVVGVETDPGALATARDNAARVDPSTRLAWVRGDATAVPLCPARRVTVLTNPPFGAQDGREGADRAFLATAADLAAVSYSVHNEGSESFVRSFAADRGGTVTHAFAADLPVERQFPWHDADRATVPVEVYRIEWAVSGQAGTGRGPGDAGT